MHGCSNIADLNTGVSLHSSPVLMETARYFGGDFAICSIKHFKSSALGVQCRFLDINGNSSRGRFPKYGNPVGNPSEPSRNQAKRIVNNMQVSHLKLELNTANSRIKQIMYWKI